MSANTRTEIQREADLVRIAEMYLSGMTQAAIAQVIGVTRPQISYDIKDLIGRWREESIHDINEAKQVELARINKLEREYWGEWERSKQDHERTLKEQTDAVKGASKKAQVMREGQCGDPRYLQGIQWCINKRCEILGLDAPIKSEVLSRGVVALTDDELAAIARAGLQQMGETEQSGDHGTCDVTG